MCEALANDSDPALVEGTSLELRDSPPAGPFDYTGLMRAAERAGLTPLWSSVASEADWDRYEWLLILNAERSASRSCFYAAVDHAEPRTAQTRIA
jgi:hypothetical protein